jgi:hypothetical protein
MKACRNPLKQPGDTNKPDQREGRSLIETTAPRRAENRVVRIIRLVEDGGQGTDPKLVKSAAFSFPACC